MRFSFPALFVSSCIASVANAQCHYKATKIERFPCPNISDGWYEPLSLNAHGTWAGYRLECPPDTSTHIASFGLFDESGIALPGADDNVDSRALDINDNDLACGFLIVDGQETPVIWQSDRWIAIDSSPGLWGDATAINNAAQVVGTKVTQQGKSYGFIWQDGEAINIDPGAWLYCKATDISESGVVVGRFGANATGKGFRWVSGNIQILEPPRGYLGSYPISINEHDQTVGRGFVFNREWGNVVGRPILWSGLTPSALPFDPSYKNTWANAVNNQGIVVGRSFQTHESPSLTTAMIWVNGVVFPIQDLVEEPVGLFVADGVDINDAGQILVYSNFNYILTPIDRPAEDLTGDCAVNAGDLAMFLGDWGKRNSCADFNSDGVVDSVDLGVLLDAWTISP